MYSAKGVIIGSYLPKKTLEMTGYLNTVRSKSTYERLDAPF